MTAVKPLLAIDLEKVGELRYPVYVSPKIDGVRALIVNGVVQSRSGKPIPNLYVQKLFGRPELEGFDGELVVGPPNAPDVMQKTMSGVMSIEGEPDVTYFVFDKWQHAQTGIGGAVVLAAPGWLTRFEELQHEIYTLNDLRALRVRIVNHLVCNTETELLAEEASYLAAGYEGLMARQPDAVYKHGRSGKRDQTLVKVKRFVDAEAEVVGVEELMHNDNEAFTDELGRTKRSTHQENKRGADMLGAFVCKTPEGVEFRIGTGRGLTPQVRKTLWVEHLAGSVVELLDPGQAVVGRIVKYRHFEASGVKDAPRFPVWLGFRAKEDLDESCDAASQAITDEANEASLTERACSLSSQGLASTGD